MRKRIRACQCRNVGVYGAFDAAGTDPHKVLAAARAFARAELEGKHRYMPALHNDTDYPHVHLKVAAASCEIDGRRFNPRKPTSLNARNVRA